jgi:hypothetical protein
LKELFCLADGIFMFFAWSVLATLSLISARRRKIPGVSPLWFVAHLVTSFGVLGFSIIGLILGLAQKVQSRNVL